MHCTYLPWGKIQCMETFEQTAFPKEITTGPVYGNDYLSLIKAMDANDENLYIVLFDKRSKDDELPYVGRWLLLPKGIYSLDHVQSIDASEYFQTGRIRNKVINFAGATRYIFIHSYCQLSVYRNVDRTGLLASFTTEGTSLKLKLTDEKLEKLDEKINSVKVSANDSIIDKNQVPDYNMRVDVIRCIKKVNANNKFLM